MVPYGADDEARTRYLHLGKVALYQMSYIRIFGASDRNRFPAGKPRRLQHATGMLLSAAFSIPDGNDGKNGASDRNRTNDTGIFSPLLYRLSYRGK